MQRQGPENPVPAAPLIAGMVSYGDSGLVIPQHAIEKVARSAATVERRLDPLWERQVDRLIALGFHKELDMEEDVYRVSLPPFPKRPSEYFDIPLIIDPRIRVSRQMQAAGLESRLHVDRVENIVEVPSLPYTIWAHLRWWQPFRFTNSQSIFDYEKLPPPQKDEVTPTLARAMQYIQEYEEGGALIELINVAFHHAIRGRNIIFALGSRTKNLSIPYSDEGYTIEAWNEDRPINMDQGAAILTRSPRINIAV